MLAAKAQAIAAQQLTVESHLERLQSLGEKAERDENYAAAIAAEVKRGEVAGFYIARREDVTRLTPEQRAARMVELAEKYPHLKRA